MLGTGFSPWPSFTEEEAKAVSQVLLSNRVNYWTGSQTRSFEKEFAQFAQANHAIAVSNGTLALDLALHGLCIGSTNGGASTDEVIVTPRSFIASVSCVVNAGARPVFADVDFDSGNLSAETIRAVVTPSTKALVIVHLAGWPCDMPNIMALAKQFNFRVIEDCAQAHGAKIGDQAIGSFGDVAAWSFCQDKIMTTGGEGGMVSCNDEALWRRMWAFKDHGKSWEAVYERQHPPGFRWLHETIGTNWRMLEMQAAIGRIQLGRMDQWHAARKHNTERIWQTARAFALARVPKLPEAYEHAYYKAYVHIRPELLKADWSRDRIITEITARGVPCYQGTCTEIYLEKAFDCLNCRPSQRLPVARNLGETSLMFLVHPTLTQAELDATCQALHAVLAQAQK